MLSQVSKSILNKINTIIVFVLLAFLAFGSGENILELFFCFGCFATIFNLFLIRQPIIFFTLAYHALQATIKVFYAEFNNVEINTLTKYSSEADLAEALRLSCCGLILMSFAIAFYLPKQISVSSIQFNVKKLFQVYIGWVFVELIATNIGQLGGFYQIVQKIAIIKWGVLFLITYTSIQRRKNIYFISLIIFEVLIGMLSYFSTFKSALFIAILSLLILGFHYYKIKFRYLLIVGSLSIVMLLIWQNIKEDYRVFLSSGEKTQAVNVKFDEAYDKILDLVREKPFNTDNTINKTIDRIAYTDFFAESINYIPNEKPHTNGAIWLESLLHIVQPRLFFPDKKTIDDSKKTMEFTGLLLADAEQGTSISLGYMAESYVDFGKYMFVIPIIVLGLLIGWLFKKLFDSKLDPIYCWGLAIPFYFQFYGFEMASEKVLGSIIAYSIVVWAIIKFAKRKLAWLEN